MKKELSHACEEMTATVLCIADNRLGPDTQTEVGNVIRQGFEELDELLKGQTKKSVLLTQIGGVGYRVESTTNFLDQKVGVTITREETEQFIRNGIIVRVVRNK